MTAKAMEPSDGEVAEVLKDLRRYGPHNKGSAFAVCDRAADLIERQQREIERLNHLLASKVG